MSCALPPNIESLTVPPNLKVALWSLSHSPHSPSAGFAQRLVSACRLGIYLLDKVIHSSYNPAHAVVRGGVGPQIFGILDHACKTYLSFYTKQHFCTMSAFVLREASHMCILILPTRNVHFIFLLRHPPPPPPPPHTHTHTQTHPSWKRQKYLSIVLVKIPLSHVFDV